LASSDTRSRFHGQAAHSGSTPMNRRRDAFLAAAKMSPEIYLIAKRHGGVCTIGSCITKPGIMTSVVEECRITLDQRHLDAAALARMLADAREAAERFAQEGGVRVAWSRIWQIAPVLFSAISLGSATPRSRRPAAARRIVCRRVRCTMPRKSPVPGCRR